MRGGFTEFCLWILLGFICVGYFLALPGCVANAILDWNGDLEVKLEPVYNGMDIVCPIAIEGAELLGEDKARIEEICVDMEEALSDVKSTIEDRKIGSGDQHDQ